MIWGIIGAMEQEIAYIKGQMEGVRETVISGSVFYSGRYRDKEVVLVCCGIGKVNAAVCSQALIREMKAGCIINTGVAGNLSDQLKVLDMVIASAVAYHDVTPGILERNFPCREEFSTDTELTFLALQASEALALDKDGHAFRCASGKVATGDQFISDSAVKEDIARRFPYPYVAVDMESAAIGHTAYINETPFLVIRSLSDDANDDADMSFDAFVKIAADNSARLVLKMLELGNPHAKQANPCETCR